MSRWRHLFPAILYGLVMLAFILRVTALDAQSLWRDETDALCYAFEFPHLAAHALAPELVGELVLPTACPSIPLVSAQDPSVFSRLFQAAKATIQHNGPLYYFLLRGWIAFCGYTPFALRYFSLLPGVLLVPLMYALGRRLFVPPGQVCRIEQPIGLLAAACAALSPYFIWYSQETKMYALVLALAVLAMYALRRAMDGHSAWWVVMVAATSVGIYLHILAALLIPVECAVWVFWCPRPGRKWLEALAALACLTLPYLPLLYWQLPLALTPAKTGYPFYPLSEMIYILLYGFSTGVVGHPAGWVMLIPLAILAAAGLIWGRACVQHKLGIIVWIALPILVLYVVSLRRPMFTDRYLIWIGPAIYVLVALGVRALWRQSRLVGLMVVIPLLIALGRGIYVQAAQPVKSDFRAAAQFVAQQAGSGDLLLFQIPHARYTFDYYYPRSFEWVDGLYTNYGMTNDEIDAQMRAAIGAHKAVWLIASEVAMWDQKFQVLGWLDTHARRTQAGQFMLVDAYRYELP